MGVLIQALTAITLFSFFDMPLNRKTLVFNVICGFVPFVVCPVCGALRGVSRDCVRTTRSLKTGPLRIFLGTILPLSVPNIVDKVVVIFVPAVSAFTVTRLLAVGGVGLFNAAVRRGVGGDV